MTLARRRDHWLTSVQASRHIKRYAPPRWWALWLGAGVLIGWLLG